MAFPEIRTKYAMWGAGLAGLAVAAFVTVLTPPKITAGLILPLAIFGLSSFLASLYQIRLSSSNVVSIGTAIFAAGVLALGPVTGAWLAAAVVVLITLADNRRIKRGLAAPPPPDIARGRLLFNTGLCAAMFLAAGYAYRLAAGPAPLAVVTPRTLLGAAAFFAAMVAVNAAYFAVVRFAQGAGKRRPQEKTGARTSIAEPAREIINALIFELPLMPAAIVLALLYGHGMMWGLAFACASLVFASMLLQRENRLDMVVNRYVSRAKSSKILANPYELLRAERRDISIVFADLRGTTGISQRLAPAEMLSLLNAFHHAMIEEVIKTGATVDKILGDGLMVLVGAPVRAEDHAAKAIALAVAMHRRYRRVRAELAARGLPEPGMGVGVAAGEVVIGNVGSELRLDYTAIGGEVNVASKLCAAAAPGEILVSTACRDRAAEIIAAGRAPDLADVAFEGRPPLVVPGLTRPLEPVNVRYD